MTDNIERAKAIEELEYLINCIKKWERQLKAFGYDSVIVKVRKEMRKAIDP